MTASQEAVKLDKTSNIRFRGGDKVAKGKLPTIVNYIDINGEEYEFDSLPAEKKEEISQLLRDRFMRAAGYKRKTA